MMEMINKAQTKDHLACSRIDVKTNVGFAVIRYGADFFGNMFVMITDEKGQSAVVVA
jgi:hypothetical protein